ncbi:MAG TPA: ATP-grasp domain-containing protein, partial [Candidatus Saccharibacteria bacterium]|nr:ATP-grasp domain-containing protein [Candidatus Saccharibacteria bacterium]
MTHILIIGKSFSGLKDHLITHGYQYTVLQDKLATKSPEKHLKNRLVVDFANPNALLEASSAIHKKKPIDGVVTIYENYVLHASRISTHLGLSGMSEKAAQACTDKELMRELFSQAPAKISPDSAVITSEKDVQTFAKSHGFPLIIKPANLSKSLLVTKSTSFEELITNYRKTVKQITSVYAKYAPGQTPKLLIEEFMEGPIFSVDAFVDANGVPHVLENVVDYQTGYDIGHNDNFHYSRLLPSQLPADKIKAIRQIATTGCRALGMTSSPAHIEIIYTKDGPRIVEIGARNGGYRERMHRLANDIDITKNALALALNQPLDIAPKKNDPVGVFELFPKTPGIFQGIKNEDAL